MDWELCKSVEERILLKSSCAAIQDNFGVTKTSIQRYLNILSVWGQLIIFFKFLIYLFLLHRLEDMHEK